MLRVIVLCLLVGVLASLFVIMFEYLLTNYSSCVATCLPRIALGVASVFGGYALLRMLRARHAMGAGVENIVYEYHIPFRATRVVDLLGKLLSTIVTVGGGGSGGVQGPSVYFGGYIGGLVSDRLGLSFIERKALMLSGIASALSTFFQTPLGAFFYALEIPYRRDLETRFIVPVLLSSITGYTLSVLVFGNRYLLPKIAVVEVPTLLNPMNILLYCVLGVVASAFIYLFILVDRALLKLRRRLSRGRRLEVLVALCYSMLFGLVIFFVPGAAGVGHLGFIRVYSSQAYIQAPLIIVTLIVAKMVATSLTIRSGASAGYFGPSLFIGGLLGLLFYGAVAKHLSNLPPLIFMYAGIAAFYGAASTAPIGISVLVTELSGNYSLIFPTLLSSFIARELIGNTTLYITQRSVRLKRSIEELILIAYRAKRILGEEVLDTPISGIPLPTPPHVKVGDSTDRVYRHYANTATPYIPLINESNKPLGIMNIEKLATKHGSPTINAGEHAIKVPTINVKEKIRKAIWVFSRHNTEVLIVIDHEGKYLGVLTVNNVRKYLITRIWKSSKNAGGEHHTGV